MPWSVCQVFPWVLTDYTSADLPLNDPRVYRDLEYPIKAQTDEQRTALQSRYRTAEEMRDMILQSSGEDDQDLIFAGAPPYHYGTFYMNSGTVVWFLQRLEPYTTQHIILSVRPRSAHGLG